MGRSRVVQPETDKIEISDGDWLLVKKQLTSGEQRRIYARMYTSTGNGDTHVDPLQAGLATILGYLLDWSLVDLQGNQIPMAGQPDSVKEAALDAIDHESFVEIRDAIERYVAARQAARDAQKKILSGVTALSAISTLPDAAGGAMSGSVS